MNQHFLQSTLWEEYQKLEGHQTFRLKNDNYEALTILIENGGIKYLFCPYGPSFQDTDSPRACINALKELARRQGCLFIRIEPINPGVKVLAHQLGMVKSHDINPATTWKLDLSPSEDELKQGIRKESVRLWRVSERKGITIRQSQNPEDIKILTSLLAKVGQRNDFTPQDENHLKNQLKAGFATLYIADFNADNKKSPIAASLVYDFDDTRIYAHAAANDDYRKLAPGTALLVQEILDAKNAGLSTFDFWGITTSEDPNHPWYGFTKFKKSFGGYQVDYAGTWDIPLNPAKYQIYNLARKANRLKRKILR